MPASAVVARPDLVEAAAARALEHPYKIWGFGEGMALLGLIRAGALLHRPQWIDAVADLIAPSLTAPADPTDHLIAVDVLRELARHRNVPIGSAVQRFADAVMGAHRPVPGRPRVHRPDLPGLSTTVWVDCLHTDGPGLTAGAAATVVEEAAAALQDASGLFSHGFDVATGRANGVHWARGQGWALHGLTAIPGSAAPRTAATTPGATGSGGTAISGAAARKAQLLAALAATELDGSWRTIVDDPGAPVEHSLSALVAACPAAPTPLRRRALAAAVAAVDPDGGLPVSSATPVGPPSTYVDRSVGIYPWGQGPLLLALLQEAPA